MKGITRAVRGTDLWEWGDTVGRVTGWEMTARVQNKNGGTERCSGERTEGESFKVSFSNRNTGMCDGFKHNYAYLQEHLTIINLYKHSIMT